MVTVRWTDGTTQSAPTAEQLLLDVAKGQWSVPPRETRERDIRRILRHRAEVWSGEPVDKALPAAKFIADLEMAGLLTLEDTSEEQR